MLLKNQSGIRHYYRGEANHGSFFDTHYATSIEVIEKFKKDPLLFEPGEGTQYTSFGYTLLAAIVEKVSNQTFTQFLNKNIFLPNNMHHTFAPDWRFAVDDLATSYAYFLPHLGSTETKPFEARRLNFSYNSGGGNIVSTSNDLIQYGIYLLKNPEITNIILSDTNARYNYGWNILTDDSGRRMMNATGASEAYQGSISIWPDDELIIVALSNTWGINSRSGSFTMPLHKKISKHILK